VGWVVIALKVKRNAQVLAHIDKLPSKDRLAALQLEMGAVNIKGNMTPEQWIRARVHSYLFFGFAILCLAGVVVLVVASVRKEGIPDVDITPYNQPQHSQEGGNSTPSGPPIETSQAPQRAVARASFRKEGSDSLVDNQFDSSSGRFNGFGTPEFTLTYDYDRAGDTINITPTLPYFSLLSRGGPISGIRYEWSPFAC